MTNEVDIDPFFIREVRGNALGRHRHSLCSHEENTKHGEQGEGPHERWNNEEKEDEIEAGIRLFPPVCCRETCCSFGQRRSFSRWEPRKKRGRSRGERVGEAKEMVKSQKKRAVKPKSINDQNRHQIESSNHSIFKVTTTEKLKVLLFFLIVCCFSFICLSLSLFSFSPTSPVSYPASPKNTLSV